MRTMRRKERAISREEALELLKNAEYGVLSTASEDGSPYGVPLSFCVIDQCIYFHCALEGHKIDNIRQNNSVSFCVVGKTKVQPDQFTTLFQSAIVSGKAGEVKGDTKKRALRSLVEKYSPDFVTEGDSYIEKLWNRTKILEITIDHISGKSKKSK